jgi:hypothetical protein
MRKIPTVFLRDPVLHRVLLEEVTPGCEWVLEGEGVATRKFDGTCVMIRADLEVPSVFVRREVKPGKEPPAEWWEVDFDEATGKRVGWEPASASGFVRFIEEALLRREPWKSGTYELCGPKINGNPEGLTGHHLIRHGSIVFYNAPRSFSELRVYLLAMPEVEGIVWHHSDGRMAKLKRRDFLVR